MDTKINTTGEKVEAVDPATLIAEFHEGRFGTWMRAIDWCNRAATAIAALEAERNDLALRAAVTDEALTNAIQMRKHAEAERDAALAALIGGNE